MVTGFKNLASLILALGAMTAGNFANAAPADSALMQGNMEAAALSHRSSRQSGGGCHVTISVKTVHSEAKPRGNIEAVLVSGAQMGLSNGGVATAAERCVYYYGPDVSKKSDTPGYKGKEWPYVRVADGCTVQLDSSVPASSPLRGAGYVDVDPATRNLRIGGVPVYQYRDDEDLTCYCNEAPEWTSILPNGNGAAFDVSL